LGLPGFGIWDCLDLAITIEQNRGVVLTKGGQFVDLGFGIAWIWDLGLPGFGIASQPEFVDYKTGGSTLIA
jgi:hypothetical protein